MSSFDFIMAVRLFPALLLPLSTALQIPTRTIGSCRTVGVDFGLARVGVAISSGFAPLPLTVLPCGGETPEDFAAVASSARADETANCRLRQLTPRGHTLPQHASSCLQKKVRFKTISGVQHSD